ncbi:MAG: glutamate-5-semialdehyde dehydrogenase, partial [Candidatus Omnitrophica bacterium]|nr:glutamate-5-semialdehyde dehydrogenase [Candidatus Omnitrophota bacterium]
CISDWAILAANARDRAWGRSRCGHIADRQCVPNWSVPMLDRLLLTEARIHEMADGLRAIARLPDPVGETLCAWRRPNGLQIRKVRVPIGVVVIVYEARPNVTADCAGLCLKSGNAVILRGGSEAHRSNTAIARALASAARGAGVPAGAIQLVPVTDRRGVDVLLSLVGLVDVVIPRGGEGLIRSVVEKAKVPVIKQYKGVCHTFVDAGADLPMARRICYNAKVQRPGVCNAMEHLLVHRAAAPAFLPAMARQYLAAGVELRGDEAARRVLRGLPVKAATEQDWPTEYLDLILSVKVVGSLDEAIRHVQRYGSGHSEAIVTRNRAHARRFLNEVDAACVYVNASTRFTDGGQFGLGAEIGISTDKLHARGPMGLEELTTYKYLVTGRGQIRG